jgi:hypothetical protein
LFAFLAYSELTAELAQNALGMIPGKSRILFYLETEFWSFIGVSMAMFGIFIWVFVQTALRP